ncbi:MAG: SWIM zinc finger family protein, partial [Vicinamibacterales bacterium]
MEPEAIAITESETYQMLLARAQRRTGAVPSESIVRHVLSITQGGDWPVQRDALDAVLRRCASAHSDEIQIVRRPPGRLLGLYATRRRDSRAHPYRTLLRQIQPLDGSCECADFLRNSLGLCKHLITVVEHVVSKRRRGDVERKLAPELAPLRWDPIRPLTGPGDSLARIRWVDGTPDRDLRRWLRPANRNGWTVAVPGASQQRLALVDRLLAALHDGNGEPALQALLQEERARLARQIQTASTRTHLH